MFANLLAASFLSRWWNWISKEANDGVSGTWRYMHRWIEHSDRGDWHILFAIVVMFGFFCMRGLHARLNA